MKVTFELTTSEARELFVLGGKSETAAEYMKEAAIAFDNFMKGYKSQPETKPEQVEVAAEILPDPQPSAPAEAPKEAEPITEEEPKAEPEKPVIKRSTAKRKLDDGKIFALRRAGWTWDKIADEMNCSIQTAINHYNEYTKER